MSGAPTSASASASDPAPTGPAGDKFQQQYFSQPGVNVLVSGGARAECAPGRGDEIDLIIAANSSTSGRPLTRITPSPSRCGARAGHAERTLAGRGDQMSGSNATHVRLLNASLDSEGLYACEISSENLSTIRHEKEIKVYGKFWRWRRANGRVASRPAPPQRNLKLHQWPASFRGLGLGAPESGTGTNWKLASI